MTGKYSSSYLGDFESSEFEFGGSTVFFTSLQHGSWTNKNTKVRDHSHLERGNYIFAVLILTQQTSGQSGTLTQLELIGRCIHELIGNYFFWSNMVCGPYIKKCVHSSAHHIAHRKFDEFFAGITLIK